MGSDALLPDLAAHCAIAGSDVVVAVADVVECEKEGGHVDYMHVISSVAVVWVAAVWVLNCEIRF